MYVLVGFLALGFICNIAVRPVAARLFVVVQPDTRRDQGPETSRVVAKTFSERWILAATAWGLAAIPLGWGVFRTLALASQMFR